MKAMTIVMILQQILTPFGTLPQRTPGDQVPKCYFITKDATTFTGNKKLVQVHVDDDHGVIEVRLIVNDVIAVFQRPAVGDFLPAVVDLYLEARTVPKGVPLKLEARCIDLRGFDGERATATVDSLMTSITVTRR